MAGCRLRLWRFGRGRLRPVVGASGVEPPAVRVDRDGTIVPDDPQRLVAAVPELDGYFYEVVRDGTKETLPEETLSHLLGRLLDRERETLALSKRIASQYEEIELLYSISETLGHTTRLEDSALTILEAVSDVVGARRASIFVHDEAAGVLRPVAALGQDVDERGPINVEDDVSITARVFRTGAMTGYDPRHPTAVYPGVGSARGYRGFAFLSAPIRYRGSEPPDRPIGVLNLTDRLGMDAFSGGERRLVAAVANHIGAAIEHARLVERDLARQRVSRELELAHGLQLKLLPSPGVLGPGVDLAARCVPARSVGGDFYHFVRLEGGRIGVMLGDVSSHGFSAALIMALVLSAAGIHAAEVASPDGTLRRLLESVANELEETEMHLSLFYGVLDPERSRLRYANAGHPHAFKLKPDGTAERLGATSPPLGLADAAAIKAASTPWEFGKDVLLLFSDGIVEARSDDGVSFGEPKVLELAASSIAGGCRDVVDAVLAAADGFELPARDDRTILALRL